MMKLINARKILAALSIGLVMASSPAAHSAKLPEALTSGSTRPAVLLSGTKGSYVELWAGDGKALANANAYCDQQGYPSGGIATALTVCDCDETDTSASSHCGQQDSVYADWSGSDWLPRRTGNALPQPGPDGVCYPIIAQISCAPAQPVQQAINLQAMNVTPTDVLLAWESGSAVGMKSAYTWRVEVSMDNGSSWQPIAEEPVRQVGDAYVPQSQAIEELEPGTDYAFRIYGVDAGGWRVSAVSNTITATTSTLSPSLTYRDTAAAEPALFAGTNSGTYLAAEVRTVEAIYDTNGNGMIDNFAEDEYPSFNILFPRDRDTLCWGLVPGSGLPPSANVALLVTFDTDPSEDEQGAPLYAVYYLRVQTGDTRLNGTAAAGAYTWSHDIPNVMMTPSSPELGLSGELEEARLPSDGIMGYLAGSLDSNDLTTYPGCGSDIPGGMPVWSSRVRFAFPGGVLIRDE